MKTIRVRNLGTVVTGHTPPTSDKEYYGGDILFIKPTDMVAGQRYTFKTEELFSEKAYKKYKSSLLPKGSTCVVCIGTLGDKLTITHSEAFTNQSVNSIIPNKSFDNDYVYYLMKYNLPKVKNLNSGTASGREFVSKTIFEKLSFDVHEDITTQKKIASILSAYDSQIENNQKRIKLLEQMAENLYKEWFVRFRFPGYETAEFEGGVPKEWKKEKLQNSVNVITGKKDANYGTDDGMYPFFTCAQEAIKSPGYSFDLDAVILAGNGDFNVKLYKGKFEAYQRTYVMNPYNPLLLYVLYYTVQDNMKQLYQSATGSTIKFLTIGMLNRIVLVVPPDNLLKRFYNACESFQKEKELLIQSTKHLTTQRDLLLPRLMSGKLSI